MRSAQWLLIGLMAAACAWGAVVTTDVVSQLTCPLGITAVKACYGPAGTFYKPKFYADVNPDKKDKLWVAATFANEGEDVITKFTVRILGWDAAGVEVFKAEENYDLAVREKPASREWSWETAEGAAVTRVVFLPIKVSLPAGRTWEANEEFINKKLAELKAGE